MNVQLPTGLLNVSVSLMRCWIYEKLFNLLDGDLGGYHNVRTCFMKQKHRLKWEEIHGPVGTGMAEFEDEEEAEAPEAEVKV